VTAASPDPVLVDLNSCDREPIHIPGSIQPHGLMLVAGCHDLRVHHVAGDVEGRLSMVWEGQPLSALITGALAGKVGGLVTPGAAGGLMGQIQGPTGERLDVSAHRSGVNVIVEVEPAPVDPRPTSNVLDGLAEAAARFELSASLTDLCDRAAIEFRDLTGFDRVMIYRFLDDGAGRVVAESRREDSAGYGRQQPAERVSDTSSVSRQYGREGVGFDFHRQRRCAVGIDRVPSFVPAVAFL
jgi:two-component system, chemotaxis family, sensor kinase Cph1